MWSFISRRSITLRMRCLALPQSLSASLLSINKTKTQVFGSVSFSFSLFFLSKFLPSCFPSSSPIHFFFPGIQGFSYPFRRSTVGLFCSTSGEFTRMGDRGVSALQSFHNQDSISYLSQRDAAEIDETLMGPLGFSVDQLMVSLYTFRIPRKFLCLFVYYRDCI